MQKKLSWEAISNAERNATIDAVKRAISGANGCIMNFNMFSDLAMSLSIEIEEHHIANLHHALDQLVHISDLELPNLNSASSREWMVYLNLSFGKGTGELKQVIPEVPG